MLTVGNFEFWYHYLCLFTYGLYPESIQSYFWIKGKITQHMVSAAGLEPARPTKPRDFKSIMPTIPPRGHVSGRAKIVIVDVEPVFCSINF